MSVLHTPRRAGKSAGAHRTRKLHSDGHNRLAVTAAVTTNHAPQLTITPEPLTFLMTSPSGGESPVMRWQLDVSYTLGRR